MVSPELAKDDPFHARLASGLVDVPRAGEVAAHDVFHRLAGDVGREVDDDILAVEGRADGFEVADVGLYCPHAVDGATVEGGELVAAEGLKV